MTALKLLVLALAAAAVAAQTIENFDSTKDYFLDKATPRFAENFEITYAKHYKVLTVKNVPDATGTKTSKKYVLVQRGAPTPDSSVTDGATVIQIPISKVASSEATFNGMLIRAASDLSLVAFYDTTLIRTPSIKAMASTGSLKDYCKKGTTGFCSIDSAVLASSGAEIVMASQYSYSGYTSANFAGSVVIVNELSESSALGRAEWVKAVAALFNKEAEANKAFDASVAEYNKLASLVSGVTYRPTVIASRAYESFPKTTPASYTWYPPGGNSYIAKLFKDAGANYMYSNDTKTGSIMVPREWVAAAAKDVDFWINPDFMNWKSLDDAKVEDAGLYANFKSIACGRVFSRDTDSYKFFESGVVYPDLVLRDLIKIFHPWAIQDSYSFYSQLSAASPLGANSASVSCSLPNSQPSSAPLSTGGIVGVVIGSAAFLAIVVGVAAYYSGYRRGYYQIPTSEANTMSAAEAGSGAPRANYGATTVARAGAAAVSPV
eukprot:tig00020614_g12209.t1